MLTTLSPLCFDSLAEVDSHSRDDIDERISSLSPERRALLERLLEARRGERPITSVEREREPLSSAQRRLWFLSRLIPKRRDYVLAGMLELDGELDRAALVGALEAVLEHQPQLRARFCVDERDLPYVTIAAPTSIVLEHSSEPGSERARALLERPFELDREPLLRLELCERGPRRHELVIVAHHLICDGGSLAIFAAELSAHYRSLRELGRAASLSRLAAQYGDFAVWEQDRLASEELREQRDWWRSHLELGPPPPLFTVADEHASELVGARTRASIDAALLAELDQCATRLATTRFAILCAAFAVSLQAHKARRGDACSELWFGTPVAGRSRPEFEPLIGLFVNMVVVRARLDADATLSSLVAALGSELAEVLARSELPFERLVEELQPSRGSGETPLLQAAISLQQPAPAFELGPDLQARLSPVFGERVTLELLLVLRPEGDGLEAWFEYACDRVDAVDVAALSETFLAALRACVREPERRVASLLGRDASRGEPTLASADELAPRCTNLSPTQLAMWMGQRLYPDAPIYNQQMICRVEAPLDADRLERAFARVVASNDALRTVIEVEGGVPRQRWLPFERGPRLELIELGSGPDADARAHVLMARRGALRFDLERSLVDTLLIRIGDERCYWCVTLHHLITDGRSFELIYERTVREYQRLSADPNAPEAEPAPSFAELHASPRVRTGARLDRAREYWRERSPAPIPALFGRRRDPSHTAVGRVCLELDARQVDGLRTLSQRPPVRSLTAAMAWTKLFATLVAALIHRLSGERELCIGVPLHHRSSSTAKQTVGALMIVCPLRVTVPRRASFAALALAVDEAFNTALKHLAGLDSVRADHRGYDVVLNYLELDFGAFAGAPTRVAMTTPGHALDTLTVNVHARGDELGLELDVSTAVCSEQRRATARAELAALIERCLADFGGPIHGARAEGLGDPALDRLAEAAGSRDRFDSPWLAIEAAARRRPDAVAVVEGARQLSWSSLCVRARAIGRELSRRGLGPGSVIAVVLPRGLDQILAVLGVVASGAAYLPIDPGLSCARTLRELGLARELGVELAVVDERQRETLATRDLELLTLAELTARPGHGAEGERPRARACHPKAPVYAMYTSGTSGSPNAVIVEQAGLLNHARWAVSAFELGLEDRVLQFASPGFDTAAEELFSCLLAGATLVLRGPEGLASPTEFWRRCQATGVTVLDLPTAYWHVLVREGQLSPTQLDRVRLVVIGGERAQRDAVVRWQQQIGDAATLLNTYGPTEATIVAASHALGPSSVVGGRELPIGRPLPGVRLELLSEDGFPVASPTGVAAELHIGGVGVATGYAKRPRLTAARFVPDPGGPPGSRLYRSGDRVSLDDDGELVFHGRSDRQLKVRGIRIEPSAIEHAALEHPAVAAAAVVATGVEQPGAIQLWVFMVPRVQPPPLADELVAAFASAVPLRGVWIDALPLTARAKVDLAALAEQAESLGKRAAVAPALASDSSDARLRRIWVELLEREADEIGEDSDFFELGGHSLLGAMLIARIERQLGVELPLRALFEHSRFAALARIVEAASNERSSGSASTRASAPILRREPSELAPLSPAQERLWFLDQLDPGNPTYDIPAAIELRGELDHQRLARAFTELVHRHEILRTTFVLGSVLGSAGPTQKINPPTRVELPLIELEQAPGPALEQAVADRIRAHASHRFALDRGPLLVAELLRCAPDRHVLLLNIHHIVADGWSVGILVRELEALYAADELPPLPIQYSDYARWQREQLASARARADRRWWKATLTGAPERLELPLDRPRPTVERHLGARLPVRFEASVGRAIEALAREHEATPYMVMLACFSALLARLSGQPELCVGSPIAGRDDPATEGLIGFFVNTLVLRISVAGAPSFVDLLRRVRASCLDAFGHRTTPFEALVEDLRPARSMAHQPLFQVMFTWLNEPTRRSLGERRVLDWRALEFDRGTANRDLTLRLEPGRETGELVGHVEFNLDLFDAATVASWIGELQALVAAVVEQPEASVAELGHAADRAQRKARVESRRAARQRSFSAATRRGRGTSGRTDELFTLRALVEGRPAPLVLEPRVGDLDVYAWLERERERLPELARRHGGVLMRGLSLDSAEQLGRACRLITPSLMTYDEPSTPRTKLEDGVYTSTEYPASVEIMAHHEMAYASHWPRWLWFFCRRPAQQGGDSPLVDGVRVRERIDPELRERFERLGVCYVRNYRTHLDLPWQRVFATDDPAQVEARCRSAGLELEWSKDGGLRTRFRAPAIAREPEHGALVWFNSAHMFHVSSLEPEVCASLRSLFADDELPRHAYFGDGSPIEDEAIAHIRAIYREEGLRFGWQRGDLLLLDNMRFAHGREPFSGARELLVAMAELTGDRGLDCK